MRKLFVVLLMLMFAYSSYALELKANGSYRIRMFNTWGGGGSDVNIDKGANAWNFGNIQDGDDDDTFFDQEFTLKLTADNGDGIKGVVMFQMGDAMWGDENDYARVGAGDNDADVEVLNAYIEVDKWIYAKAGVFTFDTPNSAVFSDETAGILIGKDFDRFAVNLMYSRLYDAGYDEVGYDTDDNVDLYGVMVPMKTDYFNVTPYFLYSHADVKGEYNSFDHNGNIMRLYHGGINPNLNVNNEYSLMGRSFLEDTLHDGYKDADMWWIGAAFDGKIPGYDIDWNLHGVYGSADLNAIEGEDLEMNGFLIDGSLTYIYDRYKFDVYGLYSSGFDEGDYNGHELDIMPTLAPGYMSYKTYAPLFFDSYSMGCFTQDPSGFSMIGGQVSANSLERLKHTFDVAYIWNMIDEDVAAAAGISRDNTDSFNYRYMFDSFVQIALINEYQIAEGTTFTMLAGALVPDANDDVNGNEFEEDTAYAINFKLQYNF
ncbi:MAG: hypothetical protein SVN78_00035 [Deferribacterota bacterium]|nr:hypothetical protein [Deferribacterota bacterium]